MKPPCLNQARILLLVCLLVPLAQGEIRDNNKIDPLFPDIPQESDRDLLIDVFDWGWLGGLMRRGRVKVREGDFSKAFSLLTKSSKKGVANKDIQGGIQGVTRSTRGTARGVLTAVQNVVILVDIGGKVYVWNKISGKPEHVPPSSRLYEQIEASLKTLPPPKPEKEESEDEYIKEFLEAYDAREERG